MSNQLIPIKLSWNTLPIGVQIADINQLGTVMAANMAGTISGDVSFYTQGSSDPTQFVSYLFYNTSQRIIKGWDSTTGKYVAITQFTPGEVRVSFVSGDEVQNGLISLDGRNINSIAGISQTQLSVLQQLFGLNGALPIYKVINNLVGVPASGTFSAISLPDVKPAVNQIGNLPFDATYSQTQVQSLSQNTETLRGSVNAINTAAIAMRDASEQIVDALNSVGVANVIYAKVFVGYP